MAAVVAAGHLGPERLAIHMAEVACPGTDRESTFALAAASASGPGGC